MKKITYSFFFLLFIISNTNCISNRSENEIIEPPDKAKSFPELSERNRLLGALLPERTCYDVLHYMINIDIDIDKKERNDFYHINKDIYLESDYLVYPLHQSLDKKGLLICEYPNEEQVLNKICQSFVQLLGN